MENCNISDLLRFNYTFTRIYDPLFSSRVGDMTRLKMTKPEISHQPDLGISRVGLQVETK
jgi:hypothetical protein